MTEIKFNENCGKVQYPTLKDARTVLNKLKTHRGKNVVDRIYRCPLCKCYHFTSVRLNDNRIPQGMYTEPKFIDRWQKLLHDSTNIQVPSDQQKCIQSAISATPSEGNEGHGEALQAFQLRNPDGCVDGPTGLQTNRSKCSIDSKSSEESLCSKISDHDDDIG